MSKKTKLKKVTAEDFLKTAMKLVQGK